MTIGKYWFPFTPISWRRDTIHLDPMQEGIYFRLVLYYMETKIRLPNNDAALARIASVSNELWLDHAAVIRAFFVEEENGKLSHKYCDSILAKQKIQSNKFIKRAKTAAKKRWSQRNENNEELCFEDELSNDVAETKHARGEESRGEEIRGKEDRESPNPSSITLNSPLTPQSAMEKRGVSKNLGGEGKAGRLFSIVGWLAENPDAEWEIDSRLLDIVPAWDRNWLKGEYDRTANKRSGNPKHPKAAFLAWVEKFYAGKKP